MKISSFGGLIVAANEERAFPLQKVGKATALSRIVTSMQQAGIFPIVILSGAKDEFRYQLSSRGVIFLQQDQPAPELFESAKRGFSFLQDCCKRIVYTPVNFPLFSVQTLRTLMKTDGDIITPSYRGNGGHPIVISDEVISEILMYSGNHGLRGALASMEKRRVWVNVEDSGMLQSVRTGGSLDQHINGREEDSLHLSAEVKLKEHDIIFDSRTKLLLFLIWKNSSVKTACRQMAISYSKAWDMLNGLEDSLKTKFISRRHGGANGGRSTLTEQGLRFLIEYQQMEEDVFQYASKKLEGLKLTLQL